VAARVAATPVAEGEVVKAGAVLLQLEDSEQRSEVKRNEALEAQAQAALAEAQAQFRRQKTLAGKGFISGSSLDAEEKKLDTARTQYEAARAQTVTARAKLEQFQIKAPAAGRLLERRAEVGDLLTVGKAVLSFAVAGPQEIRVDADERALERLQAGLPAQVQADAFPGRVLAASVARVAPRVDRNRGTVEVRLALADPAAAAFLRNDMTVSAEIVVARRDNALQIPTAAVLAALPPALAAVTTAPEARDPSTVWVWRVRDSKAELQPVRRGAESDGWSEIVSGLAAGEVVLNPAPGAAAGLLPGSKVRPQIGIPRIAAGGAAGSPQFNTAVGGGR
jgi:HlyD family secretion protein